MEAPVAGRTTSLAASLQLALDAHPHLHPIFASQVEASPDVVLFGLADRNEFARASTTVAVDRQAGEILPDIDIFGTFTFFMLRLHAELLAGPVGRLVLGVLGLCMLVSIGTGVVAYGPIMRRFRFGLLRTGRSPRMFLADLHKLLGAATLGWQALVTLTGVFLCLALLLFQGFARSELQGLAEAQGDAPAVVDFSTLDRAVAAAEAEVPGRHWSYALFPGTALATTRHFTVMLEGGAGFESHMLSIVVADAGDPRSVQEVVLPLYLKAMLICEPLHFGNYGGWPLKVLWVGFTLVSLVLALSGLWVFGLARFGRRRMGPSEGSPEGVVS